jgi:hypothetical protein
VFDTRSTPSADPFAGLLSALGAVSRATALVEFQPDPEWPGRTAYRITGASLSAVQNAIDVRMAEAERLPGANCACFQHPRVTDTGFESLGYVVIETVSPPLAPVL